MIRTYTVKEIIEWNDAGTLKLRPEFQRRPNWPIRAKCYFIDTILRNYPSPLLYLRPTTDPKTKQVIRQVVDGQQRLTAIVEFHKNQLRLDAQTNEYEGLTFDELDTGDQQRFLLYQMPVEELFNASDDYILDVFHRLNAYGLRLNPQEIRHGKFQGEKFKGIFRHEVIEASKRWSVLWDRYKIVSIRQRLRMIDDELMAQMFGILLDGVKDGGQPYINDVYGRYDATVPQSAIQELDNTIDFILKNFSGTFDTRLKGAPHFLMLFAAVAHALVGLPKGDMGERGNPPLPQRDRSALSNIAMAKKNLATLADVLKMKEDEVPPRFFEFRVASAGTTQRIRSRSRRFVALYKALLPKEI